MRSDFQDMVGLLAIADTHQLWVINLAQVLIIFKLTKNAINIDI